MARMTSPVFGIIRGSINGATYLANQYHQIICRGRTAPVQPNTQIQTMLRSSFAGAAGLWKGLTGAERQDWQQFAQTVVYAGPLGNYYVTGRNLMMGAVGLVKYLRNQYLPTITVVPTVPPGSGRYQLNNVVPAVLAAAGVGFQISISNTYGVAIAALVEISRPFDVSRNRYKGPWDTSRTQAKLIANPSTSVVTFEDLIDGYRYFYRVRAVTASAAGVPAIHTVAWEGSFVSTTVV